MKILTLADVVNHNANMTSKALEQIKGMSKSILLLGIANFLIVHILLSHEKDIKKLKEENAKNREVTNEDINLIYQRICNLEVWQKKSEKSKES